MTNAELVREELRRRLTRRWFFRECGVGLGAIALADLLGRTGVKHFKLQSSAELSLNHREALWPAKIEV